MANQRLTQRSYKSSSDSNDIIHIVSGDTSFKQKMSIAVDNKIQLVSDQLTGISSGYKGFLAIADTPTEDGYYYASESGTYTNAGGLVVSLSSKITIITVSDSQTTFEKLEIPIDTLGYEIVRTIGEFDSLVTAGTSGVWLILGDITLTADKTLPSNTTLYFSGGSISFGGFDLTGNNTVIDANIEQIFDDTGSLLGTWSIKEVYPEWFGALGDGVNDDTLAIQAALDTTKKVVFRKNLTYKVISTLNGYGSVDGNGSTLSFESGTYINGLDYSNIDNFKVENIKLTSTNTTNLFTQGAQALEFVDCSNFSVENCECSYFTDGVSITTSENFNVVNNNLHDMGEELIAVRYSTGWSLINNLCYNHNGDGILIKGNALHGGLIKGNTVKDGVDTYGYSVFGGGITCNLEGGDTTAIEGLAIESNIVSATSYGIALVGAIKFNISSNKILDLINGKGIYIDVATVYNPNSVKGGNGIIDGNIIVNIFDDEGIVSTTSDGVGNLPCIISNNYIDLGNSIQNAVRVENAILTGNYIKGGLLNLTATNSTVTANTFDDTDATTDAGIKLFQKTTFSNNTAVGWNNYIQVRADFTGAINSNSLDTSSSQNLITILSGAKGTITGNYLTNSGAGGIITEIDGVYVDNFTRRKGIMQSRVAAPTSGTWALGDIVWKATPTPSGNIGWVCVTAGSPGTWKSFGTIAS